MLWSVTLVCPRVVVVTVSNYMDLCLTLGPNVRRGLVDLEETHPTRLEDSIPSHQPVISTYGTHRFCTDVQEKSPVRPRISLAHAKWCS